ncbi:MAG: hypothetical protein RTU92_05090 [Candidatus Thorarchaeota archaeon]
MTKSGKIDRISESLRIIQEGQKHGAVLRMIGGLAVRAHCEDLEFCEREYGDVDLVALGKQVVKIRSTFVSLGYSEDLSVARSTDGTRLLFHRNDLEDHVDVFLDKLRMEHTIDLRDRLQIEDLTITVSDVIITKLIIHVMNEKDYRDIFTIMKDMEMGHEDTPGLINVNYIASVCSKDWGLFQDITSKIDECLQVMSHYNFSQPESDLIRTRFLSIKESMEREPKSLKWKLRSLMGTRIAIRDVVEEENLQVTDLSSELSKSKNK